jgi:hypothetical protein
MHLESCEGTKKLSLRDAVRDLSPLVVCSQGAAAKGKGAAKAPRARLGGLDTVPPPPPACAAWVAWPPHGRMGPSHPPLARRVCPIPRAHVHAFTTHASLQSCATHASCTQGRSALADDHQQQQTSQ